LQAADRFMRLMEKKGPTAPQHLVVFITSDEDFSEQIAQLQSRNFQVAVLYHHPSASKKAVGIGHAANISHDWLPFLTRGLNNPHLTLTYDPNLYFPAGPTHPNQDRRQFVAGSPQQAAALAQGPKFGQLPAAQVQPSTWAADPLSSSSCVAVYAYKKANHPLPKELPFSWHSTLVSRLWTTQILQSCLTQEAPLQCWTSTKLLSLSSKQQMWFQLWMGSSGATAS